MHNNPFAEGHHAPEPEPRRQRAQSEDHQQEPLPFGNLGGGVGRLDGGQGATPLSYLFSLLNSFGVNMGGGQAGNYAWGEADFQQILNDLMEQVRWLVWRRKGEGVDAHELIPGFPFFLHRLLDALDPNPRRRTSSPTNPA